MKYSDLGQKSVSRNPLIASLMLRAKYIEKLGTGIKRIRNLLNNANLEPPEFEIDYFFNIKFIRESIEIENTLSEVTEVIAQKTSQKTSQKVARLLSKYPDITIAELANTLSISTRAVKYNLEKLKNTGIIQRVGPDKGGHWEIIK